MESVVVDTGEFDRVWSAASMDAVLTLLGDAAGSPGGWDFHSRVCEAIGRTAGLERVTLLIDASGEHDRIAGAWGIPRALADGLRPTGAEAAALRDAGCGTPVFMIGDGGSIDLPRRFRLLLGTEALVCVPLYARSRLLGFLVGDRGGGRFEPSAQERCGFWLAGKMAALVLTSREGTSREQRVMRMKEWIDVGLGIHERVVQRLAGVSMVMSAEAPLTHDDLCRARTEIAAALAELRRHLQAPFTLVLDDERRNVRDKVLSLTRATERPPVVARWSERVQIPAHLQPLVEHFLEEAVTNARKHARATKIELDVSLHDRVVVDVVNDGVSHMATRSLGCGQRLLAAEAQMHGCDATFQGLSGDRWRARLTLPPEGGMQ